MLVHGIILAAGDGARFGGAIPKQLRQLGDRAVLAWSLAAFASAGIDRIVVATQPALIETVSGITDAADGIIAVVAGGGTRAESARIALESVDGSATDCVLIHDAARPLVTPESIAHVVAALADADAVTLAVPVTDTIVEGRGGAVTRQLDRGALFCVQTPQGFRLDVIREAHRLAADDAHHEPTDDAGLVHRYLNLDVRLVAGDPGNIKITTPTDLAFAEALISSS